MSDHGARFEPYVKKAADGRVVFANRWLRGVPFPRGWPGVFAPRRRRRWKRRMPSAQAARSSAMITRVSDIEARLRWIPCNPLLVHAMSVEDAITDRLRLGARRWLR